MTNNTIPFSLPATIGSEIEYIKEAVDGHRLSGDRAFSEQCARILQNATGAIRALLTPSCTHALEMSAILFNIKPGDEVIMPSFTFASTANAFVLRGAKIVFVDIRPDTLNLDENLVEEFITDRTRAIVPVHYASVACEMDTLNDIAKSHDLYVVEDAAQGVGATYKGRPLGSIGHLGTFSFHETKNLQCGEGGALLVNDETLLQRSEIVREKGTNRAQFFRGEVDKYTWLDMGSSELLGELSAAFLFAQLESIDHVTRDRMITWSRYQKILCVLEEKGKLELPHIPSHCGQNGHIFYVKMADETQRNALLSFLNKRGIGATFHYVPLHSAPAGQKFGIFRGEDRYTTKESSRLLRFPIYYNMSPEDVDRVCEAVVDFFEGSR